MTLVDYHPIDHDPFRVSLLKATNTIGWLLYHLVRRLRSETNENNDDGPKNNSLALRDTPPFASTRLHRLFFKYCDTKPSRLQSKGDASIRFQ